MSWVIPTSILFSIGHLVLKPAQQMVEKLADAYNGRQRTKHAHAAANGPDHATAHNAAFHAAFHAAAHNAPLMQFTPEIYQSFPILWQHGGSMLQWRMAPCVTANFYKNLSLRKIILSLQQKWICEGCCGDKILFLRQTFVNNLLVHTKLFVAQCVVQIVEATQLFLDRV